MVLQLQSHTHQHLHLSSFSSRLSNSMGKLSRLEESRERRTEGSISSIWNKGNYPTSRHNDIVTDYMLIGSGPMRGNCSDVRIDSEDSLKYNQWLSPTVFFTIKEIRQFPSFIFLIICQHFLGNKNTWRKRIHVTIVVVASYCDIRSWFLFKLEWCGGNGVED